MTENIKAYYAKKEVNQKGKQKFIYVELKNDARDLFGSTLRTCVFETGTSEEIHLTTDGAWELYLSKRKCIPKFVRLFDTQKNLDAAMDLLGVGI